MKTNKGYDIEDQMRLWFRGEKCEEDFIDFKTKTTCYEVKSCNLLNECVNGNHKRKHSGTKHKKCRSTQLGRFFIVPENHRLLGECSQKKKYIFVLRIGRQKVWKVWDWNEVEKRVDYSKSLSYLKISEVFCGIYS